MTKSEYEEKLSNEINPYEAWIEKYEERFSEREIEGDVSALITALGYTLFTSEHGTIDPMLYEYVSKLAREKNPELIYTDEDVMSVDGKRCKPYFKPEFSPDTLGGFFYLGGLLLIRNDLLKDYSNETGRYILPKKINQDSYDVFADIAYYIFKKNYAITHDPARVGIHHISKVLFHSTKEEEYLYLKDKTPTIVKGFGGHKISTVILSKDNPGVLLSCIRSLLRMCNKTAADDELEVIVVDNGSSEDNRKTLEKMLPEKNILYFYNPCVFEYSTLCNIGASKATGDVLLFLNDDVLFSSENPDNVLLNMLTYATRDYIGAVGIKLLFPGNESYGEGDAINNLGNFHAIQHAGICMMNVGPSHKLASFLDDKDYYFGRNTRPYNYLAVTGACLMVMKNKFDSVGGFDEALKISYTDVDLCLDLYSKGLYSVCLNDTFAFHFESLSRGNDVVEKGKAQRLKKEREIFFKKHIDLLNSGDIFTGPNITKQRLDYSVDFTQDWERFSISEVEDAYELINDTTKELKEVGEKEILGHIDRVNYIASSVENMPSYYEIEGWMIIHGRDQLNYDIYLGLRNKRYFKLYRVERKYRHDLVNVFPKEKNQALSGFILRISEDDLERYDVNYLSLVAKNIKNGFIREKIKYRETKDEICLGS